MFLQSKCFGSVSNKLKLSDSKRGGGAILQGDAEHDDDGSDEYEDADNYDDDNDSFSDSGRLAR